MVATNRHAPIPIALDRLQADFAALGSLFGFGEDWMPLLGIEQRKRETFRPPKPRRHVLLNRKKVML